MRQQGDMVQHLKKNNPKQFFKNFNRHNSRPPYVSLEDFFEHFRNLASDSSSTYTCISIANYLDTDNPLFKSFGNQIYASRDRRKLKNHKCAGEDNLINEYFSEFSEIILPILVHFLTKYSIQEYFQRHGRKQLLYFSTKKEIPTIPGTTEESVSPVVLGNSSLQSQIDD